MKNLPNSGLVADPGFESWKRKRKRGPVFGDWDHEEVGYPRRRGTYEECQAGRDPNILNIADPCAGLPHGRIGFPESLISDFPGRPQPPIYDFPGRPLPPIFDFPKKPGTPPTFPERPQPPIFDFPGRPQRPIPGFPGMEGGYETLPYKPGAKMDPWMFLAGFAGEQLGRILGNR